MLKNYSVNQVGPCTKTNSAVLHETLTSMERG